MPQAEPIYLHTECRLLCICGGWLMWRARTGFNMDFDPMYDRGGAMIHADTTLEFSHVGTPGEFCVPYKEGLIFLLKKEEQERFERSMRDFESYLHHYPVRTIQDIEAGRPGTLCMCGKRAGHII